MCLGSVQGMNKAVGQNCNRNSQCLSRRCQDGKCRAVLGDSCTRENHCLNKHTCYAGTCQEPFGFNAKCATDDNCDGRRCLGGYCRGNRDDACQREKECRGRLTCFESICQDERQRGESCDESVNCAGKAQCYDGKCVTRYRFKVLTTRDGFITFCCVGVGCDNICEDYDVMWDPIPGYNLVDIVNGATQNTNPTPDDMMKRRLAAGTTNTADTTVTDAVALPSAKASGEVDHQRSRQLDTIPSDMEYMQWWRGLSNQARKQVIDAIIATEECTVLAIVFEWIKDFYPLTYQSILANFDLTQADVDAFNMYCLMKAEAACETVAMTNCCRSGTCFDDPHFKTWTGQSYDFHGKLKDGSPMCSLMSQLT